MKLILDKLSAFSSRLNKRERVLWFAVAASIPIFLLVMIVTEISDYLASEQELIEKRLKDLETISRLSQSYQSLQHRYSYMKNIFAQSQMTSQQAYTNLDDIVKKSIGAERYELKNKGENKVIGDGFEQQEYQLKISSLSREQLVKFLYEVEQGKSPLFLKRVDIVTKAGNTFEATLEIYSISRTN